MQLPPWLGSPDGTIDRTHFDIFDARSLFNLATTGYIPVVFSLVCITRYGHATWYIIMLSLCSVGLSTATLGYLLYVLAPFFQPVNDNDWQQIVDGWTTSCGTDNEQTGQLMQLWCGPNFQWEWAATSIIHGYEWNKWHWLLWTNCILWIFFCVIKQTQHPEASPRFLQLLFRCFIDWISSWMRTSIIWSARTNFYAYSPTGPVGRRTFWRSNMWGERFPISVLLHWAGSFLFVATWSISFAYQFYFFSFYWRMQEISNEWSFGQIIAVSVWLPSIVEYIYLLISKLNLSVL